MLYKTDDAAAVRKETVDLACGIARARGLRKTPPKVEVRYTDKRHVTGRCVNKNRIVLSLARGSSVPQALALICHEVAHWLAPTWGHGEQWRKAFRECLAAYEADPGPLLGRKGDVHTTARQALAARLGQSQVGVLDEAGADVPVVTEPVDLVKRESVLRKVAAALKLAEHASNEHEASTAALTASRLLRAYRLSMEDVTAAERERDDPLIDRHVCQGTKRRVAWRVRLGFGLARVLGCYALNYPRGAASCGHPRYEAHRTMCAFGRQSAVLVFEHLYTYLLREIDQIGREKVREEMPASPRAWGAAFRLGAVEGVLAKIQDDLKESEVRTASSETGLVLARKDYIEAEQYAYAVAGHTIGRAVPLSGGAYNPGARNAGRAVGKQIRVNRAVPGGVSGPKMLTKR